MSIDLDVMKKSTDGSYSISFCFDDKSPLECTVHKLDSESIVPDKAGNVLLLKHKEIASYSIEGCLTFKITKVETNSIP